MNSWAEDGESRLEAGQSPLPGLTGADGVPADTHLAVSRTVVLALSA